MSKTCPETRLSRRFKGQGSQRINFSLSLPTRTLILWFPLSSGRLYVGLRELQGALFCFLFRSLSGLPGHLAFARAFAMGREDAVPGGVCSAWACSEGLSGWGTWRLADGGQGRCETLQCPTRNP